MEIYELVGTLDAAESSQAWRQLFGNGRRHFQHAEWDEAVAAFNQVIVMRGDDGPSRFYLRQIEKLREGPLPPKWFGEVSMIDGGPRTATVTAATPLRTFGVPSWDFHPLLKSSPSITFKLLVTMCSRLRDAEKGRTAVLM